MHFILAWAQAAGVILPAGVLVTPDPVLQGNKVLAKLLLVPVILRVIPCVSQGDI